MLRTGETFRLCFSFAYNVTLFGYTFDKSHDENQICLDDIIMSIIRSICSVFSPLKGKKIFSRADRGPCHIETSQLTCSANQWTGFYIIGTSITIEFNSILGAFSTVKHLRLRFL